MQCTPSCGSSSRTCGPIWPIGRPAWRTPSSARVRPSTPYRRGFRPTCGISCW
ncbi:hypothetical protein NKG94_12180 [Micromonospora sp. M12]